MQTKTTKIQNESKSEDKRDLILCDAGTDGAGLDSIVAHWHFFGVVSHCELAGTLVK